MGSAITIAMAARTPDVGKKLNWSKTLYVEDKLTANSTAEEGFIALEFHRHPDEIETLWRSFEQTAVCGANQQYDWLNAWACTASAHYGEKPVVVVGRSAGGKVNFILPLAGAVVLMRWEPVD